MHDATYKKLLNTLNENIHPLKKVDEKYIDLIDRIGESRFVLIGEASHGTREFYERRAEITQQLESVNLSV